MQPLPWDSHSTARKACEVCRERKTRCDRGLPACSRCLRLRQHCTYEDVVQRRRPRDEQLHQLQERLAATEAQLAHATTAQSSIRLDVATARESSLNTLDLPHGFGSDMAFDWTDQPLAAALEPLDDLLNRLPNQLPSPDSPELKISPAELGLLHGRFFEFVCLSFPFVNQSRFAAEVLSGSGGPAQQALVYAVALSGCTEIPEDQNKQTICYNMARDYAENCERSGKMNDIDFLQALLLIGRHEAMRRKLERSWLTLGRAAMVCRLLGLQEIDRCGSRGVSHLQLPDTNDQALLEERRRTFWGLYILQSYMVTRTGWPCQLGAAKNFQVKLPSPGPLTSDFTPVEMPLLVDAADDFDSEISSYAGCVLMVELALRCFEHEASTRNGARGFWDEYCELVKATDKLSRLTRRHLNATSIRQDPIAFSLCLNLRATEVFLHELAITQSETQGLPPLMTAEGQRRAAAAASQISSAVRLSLPSTNKAAHNDDIIMLQAIFVAWPLVMALKAFHRELVADGANLRGGNGVVASSRLLFAALDHIEESDGHWHQSVAHVESNLQAWDEQSTSTWE